jgi:hypothetical protein
MKEMEITSFVGTIVHKSKKNLFLYILEWFLNFYAQRFKVLVLVEDERALEILKEKDPKTFSTSQLIGVNFTKTKEFKSYLLGSKVKVVLKEIPIHNQAGIAVPGLSEKVCEITSII